MNMDHYLLQSETGNEMPKKGTVFMCPNCNKFYTSAVVYYPIKGLSPHFMCIRCQSIYPFHHLKQIKWWKTYFSCCY